MSVVLNTNTASLFAARALKNAVATNSTTIQKLSSGVKINRAADDSAGLSINEKLTSRLRGISQAEKNINDAFGVLDFAFSGIKYVTEQFQRVRELWVQAENGTNSIDERDAIQRELNERIDVVTNLRLPENNPWNASIFRGTAVTGNKYSEYFQVGSEDSDSILLDFSDNIDPDNAIDFANMSPGAIAEGASASIRSFSVGSNVPSLGGGTAKAGSLTDIDIVIKNLSRMSSVVNKYQAQFQAALDKIQEDKLSYSAFKSQVLDTDFAKTSSEYASDQIRSQSAASVLTQANAQARFVLNLLP